MNLSVKRVEIKPLFERIFGGLFGIINGVIIASGFLIIISASPNAGREIDANRLSPHIRNYIPKVYEKLERNGISLPKWIGIPANYQDELSLSEMGARFTKINFVQLDGSHCMNCGHAVKFDGYFPKYGAVFVPRFTCENCHRTSDGCQTYEGFHKMYGVCPVDLARKGQLFDCGNWPNHLWIIPKGPCPVDGKQLDISEWKSPVPY